MGSTYHFAKVWRNYEVNANVCITKIFIYITRIIYTAYWSSYIFRLTATIYLAVVLTARIFLKFYILSCISQIFGYIIMMGFVVLPLFLSCEELLHIAAAKGKGLQKTIKYLSVGYLISRENKIIVPLSIGVKFQHIPCLADALHITLSPVLLITILSGMFSLVSYFLIQNISSHSLQELISHLLRFLLAYWLFSVIPITLIHKNDSAMAFVIMRKLGLSFFKLLREISMSMFYAVKGLFL
ncbi:MAG: hypothetical protein B5M53_05500 [Candidatus Cloacimonas sp. 4484_209]|nr:MAG: hypothetical protein B5M53_05500 [Candidatus Cloacimonas sp. 4484_209]